MRIKFYPFYCILWALCLQAFSSEIENTGQFFDFETDRTYCRLLQLKDLEAAQEVDHSSLEYWCLENPEEFKAVLLFQEKIFQEALDLDCIRQYGKVYYGAFLKKEPKLIEIIEIHNFLPDIITKYAVEKGYLSTDAKIHKAYQGGGIGTEVKKGLLDHFQNKRLIPLNEKDKDSTSFLGFYGLVHLTNKASLKYNIINCQYKAGRLFGDRVEIFYPQVFSSFSSTQDAEKPRSLHEQLKPLLLQYLSRDEKAAASAEKCLREQSLNNLLKVNGASFHEAADEEFSFMLNTLTLYPEFINLFSKEHFETMRSLIEEKKNLVATMPVAEHQQKDYQTAIKNLTELYEMFRTRK